MPLPRDVLCTLPLLGTVLRVIFSQNVDKHCLHLLNTGEWVKFVNVLFEVEGGLLHGVLTPFTKLRYTPNEDSLVLERQRLLILLDDMSLNWYLLPLLVLNLLKVLWIILIQDF